MAMFPVNHYRRGAVVTGTAIIHGPGSGIYHRARRIISGSRRIYHGARSVVSGCGCVDYRRRCYYYRNRGHRDRQVHRCMNEYLCGTTVTNCQTGYKCCCKEENLFHGVVFLMLFKEGVSVNRKFG